MSSYLRLGATALVSATFTLACEVSPPAHDARPLTSAEAAAVKGGVAVDIQSPGNNSSSIIDNVRFNVDLYDGSISDPSYVALYADSTKVGYTSVQFQGNETIPWDQRFDWPYPGYHDAQFKAYWDGQWYESGGDSSRVNIRINPLTKVRRIRFWNVKHKTSNPSVSSSFTKARVDSTDIDRSKTADNIDGIFAQCSGSDQTQWRSDGTGTLNPTYNPGAGFDCSDLGKLVDPGGPCAGKGVCTSNGTHITKCDQLKFCIQDYATALFNWDNSHGHVAAHVFHVKSTPCNSLGVNIPGLFDGNGERSIILLDDSSAGNAANYTKQLAHELIHDIHIDHCNQGSGGSCAAEDCSSNTSNENIMCSSGPGRDLNAAQCNLIKNMHFEDTN